MSLSVAAFGALSGAGILLIVAGLRGVRPGASRRRPSWVLTAPRRQEVLLRLALATAGAVVALLATGWVVGAFLTGVLGAVAPTLFGGGAARRRFLARIEAIAAWTEMLRDVSAAGSGIQEAIAATASLAPVPIRDEVGVLALRLERDRLQLALMGFADDLSDPMADLVVAALLTAATEQTRRLGELLSALAGSIRDQAAMRLRVEAGRARTRVTARAVAGVSIASATFLLAFDRGFLRPYSSALGQVVLGLVGACFAGAFWLLARMGAPVPPRRLLPSQAHREASEWS